MANKIKSEIKVTVELDENRIPDKLSWSARDGGVENENTKAVLMSVWDSKTKETLRIDLWTKDMPVDEMKIFFHQTLVAACNRRRKNGSNHERFLFVLCRKIRLIKKINT